MGLGWGFCYLSRFFIVWEGFFMALFESLTFPRLHGFHCIHLWYGMGFSLSEILMEFSLSGWIFIICDDFSWLHLQASHFPGFIGFLHPHTHICTQGLGILFHIYDTTLCNRSQLWLTVMICRGCNNQKLFVLSYPDSFLASLRLNTVMHLD